jgi:hypothetical protein
VEKQWRRFFTLKQCDEIARFAVLLDARTMEQFQALPMSWKGASAAYPLVLMHDGGITLDKWLRFARRYCRLGPERAGLIAVRDRRGIVHALFSYRVEVDLHDRKRLCVANLIVAHLPGSRIEEAVVTSARDVSAELGCQTISIEQQFHPLLGLRQPRCSTAEALRWRARLVPGGRLN